MGSTKESIEVLVNAISEKLQVVNRGLFDPEDFNESCLEDLQDIHKMIMMKSTVSISEKEAILTELSKMRKK
ncbi:DUF1128 family protein [Lottiidibacillus patelloidae]|uniref:DUF1128 family protein n=1 Tax=Lottiidibacillus patelloidae TaxID=2670334 RepID=UPI0013033CCD|nr:DUF1128 family protein [Lottiidibacillus patelloidae]